MDFDKLKKYVFQLEEYLNKADEKNISNFDDIDDMVFELNKIMYKIRRIKVKKGIIGSEIKNHDALFNINKHYRRENAYYELLSFNEAISELKRVIDESTDDHVIACAHNALGHIYAVKGYYDDALYNFQKVIDFYSDNVDVYFNIGITYLNLNQYEEAIREFRKVINLDKNDKETLFFLNICYKEINNNDLSNYYYNKYIEA
jgi:tetratricopeptide (TPR) repeat protein